MWWTHPVHTDSCRLPCSISRTRHSVGAAFVILQEFLDCAGSRRAGIRSHCQRTTGTTRHDRQFSSHLISRDDDKGSRSPSRNDRCGPDGRRTSPSPSRQRPSTTRTGWRSPAGARDPPFRSFPASIFPVVSSPPRIPTGRDGDRGILNGWWRWRDTQRRLPAAPGSRATGWCGCRRHDAA